MSLGNSPRARVRRRYPREIGAAHVCAGPCHSDIVLANVRENYIQVIFVLAHVRECSFLLNMDTVYVLRMRNLRKGFSIIGCWVYKKSQIPSVQAPGKLQTPKFQSKMSSVGSFRPVPHWNLEVLWCLDAWNLVLSDVRRRREGDCGALPRDRLAACFLVIAK